MLITESYLVVISGFHFLFHVQVLHRGTTRLDSIKLDAVSVLNTLEIRHMTCRSLDFDPSAMRFDLEGWKRRSQAVGASAGSGARLGRSGS